MTTKRIAGALLTLVLYAVLYANGAVADTLIHAGHVIDGESGDVADAVTIRVAGKSITAIENGFTSPGPGDDVIDLSEQTVMPGLMDMHVHLTGEYGEDSRLRGFITNEADYAYMAANYARRTLEAGFTTVRNLGGPFNVTIALRDAIERGDVVGPTVFSAAKSLATTGGHADPTNGWASHIMGDPGPAEGVVNGVADARKAVRQRYKDGADWIKITATGGVLSVAKSGQNPQFTDEELKAIVDTAADYGLRVAAHAHGTEGMKRAVEAGVVSIEHGTYMDAEVMRLMKRNGTWYVPTIMAGNWVAEKSKIDGFFPDLVRPKAAAIRPDHQEHVRGKPMRPACPSCSGPTPACHPHGDNGQEFALMVEGGMPPMEAIRSATSVAGYSASGRETQRTRRAKRSGCRYRRRRPESPTTSRRPQRQLCQERCSTRGP
ncbi:MAG: amidohydrolase family protein [Woeseiaceae bacterium]|nr:amidohydrolase family protein [Woeseiaceae bacterium]